MKLTLVNIINLQGGLIALDAYDKIVGDKVVKELYQLGGPLRLTIARNLNRIEPEIVAFRRARNDLVKQYTNGDASVDMMKFANAERELLDTEVDLDLRPIKEADLALDKNPIPGTVLASLMPILEE